MSHILSAGVYIADSKQGDLTKGDSFFILSDIIRHIIDGKYSDAMIHLESVQFKSQDKSPIKTIFTGISLGDGEVHISSRGDVENNIRGRKGKIGVLYELDSQLLTLDLADIQTIIYERVHNLVQLDDMAGTLVYSNGNFSTEASFQSRLATSMH